MESQRSQNYQNENEKSYIKKDELQTDQQLQEVKKDSCIIRILKFLFLLTSLIGGSFIGPTANIVKAQGIFLKQSWRYSSLLFLMIAFSPFYIAYMCICKQKIKKDNEQPEQKMSWFIISMRQILSVVFQIGWSFGIFWGSLNTIQSHAYTLNSLHGVITLIFYILTCQKVHYLEIIGTLIVFAGAIIMILDPQAKKVGEEANITASMLTVLGSIPASLYFANSRVLVPQIGLQNFLLFQNVLITIFFVILAVFIEQAEFLSLSDNGVFGFLRPDNMFICLFIFGFMCTFFGNFGFIISQNFFYHLVVMNCLLLHPILSQIWGVFLNLDEIPGLMTFSGVILIIIAINIIYKGSQLKQQQISFEKVNIQMQQKNSDS